MVQNRIISGLIFVPKNKWAYKDTHCLILQIFKPEFVTLRKLTFFFIRFNFHIINLGLPIKILLRIFTGWTPQIMRVVPTFQTHNVI